MKKVITMMMVVAFLFIPVVMAQEENNINEIILPTTTNDIDLGYIEELDNLTITVFVPDGVELYINVLRGGSQVLSVNSGVVGNFSVTKLIEKSGTHTLKIYNLRAFQVTILGWWAINWNGTITNTTTGTTTTGTDTTTGRPTDLPDYLGIFLEVMVRYVIPVIVVVVIVALIFRYCRGENFDYLVMFDDREMVERQMEQEEEEN